MEVNFYNTKYCYTTPCLILTNERSRQRKVSTGRVIEMMNSKCKIIFQDFFSFEIINPKDKIIL